MLGFSKAKSAKAAPGISTRICVDRFNGKYPHVGVYDCRQRKIWICKPQSGEAIHTPHTALFSSSENNDWQIRFICFWFYTPHTGKGYVLGYPIDWDEAHLIVQINPHWDFDHQCSLADDLSDQIEDNVTRQYRHADRIVEFYKKSRLHHPFNVHFIGQRATESQFYVHRINPVAKG